MTEGHRLDLASRLRQAGQEHLVPLLQAEGPASAALREQLEAVDLQGLPALWRQIQHVPPPAPVEELEELPVLRVEGEERQRLRRRGEACLARGEAAVLTVAGGQGTRLGFPHPKGCYPLSPVRQVSLLHLFGEGLARARRSGPLPWVLMTSPATEEETHRHLAAMTDWLGPPGLGFSTFVQGMLPALDQEGRMLLEAPGRLALAPDGHGGALEALEQSGTLERLAGQGVRHLFYHQVDNPLGERPDPVMLGAHLEADAEISTKVVRKTDPVEKVGLLVQLQGRTRVLEYSELPTEIQHRRRVDGTLELDAANVAVHIFSISFLQQVAARGMPLPLHGALKKVPHLDREGRPVEPATPNAWKLERFIFDLLPLAERHLTFMVPRMGEFHPLKEATGEFSPEGVRDALSSWWASWLEQAGLDVPGPVVEISPRLARHAGELAPPYRQEATDRGVVLLPG